MGCVCLEHIKNTAKEVVRSLEKRKDVLKKIYNEKQVEHLLDEDVWVDFLVANELMK